VAPPTTAIRRAVYVRDEFKCVRCGRGFPDLDLEFQHRAAVGAGGSKKGPTIAEGLAACSVCNSGFESFLQTQALRYGWKVRRWVFPQYGAESVPVYYGWDRQWFRLVNSVRIPISEENALLMMRHIYGDEYGTWESQVLPS
jgi:hypothetical protein